MSNRRWGRRIMKGLALVSILGGLGVGVLVASLWIERRAELTLPTPTGPFGIGRAIYDWTEEVDDPLAPVRGTKRELLVWIWYPTAPGQAVDDYVPAQMRAATGPSGGLWGLLTRDVTKVHGHSAREPGVSPRRRPYPVLIMRAGSAGVVLYSAIAENLTSHGYVVVGFDALIARGVVAFRTVEC